MKVSILGFIILSAIVVGPQRSPLDPVVLKALAGDEPALAEIRAWEGAQLAKLEPLFDSHDIRPLMKLQVIVLDKNAYFGQPDVFRRIVSGASRGLYQVTIWSWVFAELRSPVAASSLLGILREPDSRDQFLLAIWTVPEYCHYREDGFGPRKTLYSAGDQQTIVGILAKELQADDALGSKYASTSILRIADPSVLDYIDADGLQTRSASIVVGTLGQMPCKASREMLVSIAANPRYGRDVREKARSYLAKGNGE